MRQIVRPGVHEAPGRLRAAPIALCPSSSPSTRIMIAVVSAYNAASYGTPRTGQPARLALRAAMLRLLRRAFIRPWRDVNSRNPGSWLALS